MRSKAGVVAVFLCLIAAGIFLTQLSLKAQAPAKADQIPGFDITALDKQVDACTDFYQFACGGWRAHNPIPGDQATWGRFNELAEHNRAILHDILETAAKPDPKRTPVERMIGDYYASCMDEKTVDAEGAKPLQPELQRIAAIKDRHGLVVEVAHLYTLGIPAVFSFGGGADLHDASMTIATIDQGGLGLPDRDYYLKEDPKSVETRQKYVEHMRKMFELLGDQPPAAAAAAKSVMALETSLAKISMARVDRRDPKSRDHKMTVPEAAALAPNFELARFFTGATAPKFTSLNVGNPDFFKQANPLLESVPLADWQNYLRWRVVRQMGPMLSSPFVEESFRFNGQYLGGQKELEPRWKRCTGTTDRLLGEALGKLFVERAFGKDSKERTLKMVHAIEAAMADDINTLPWMTDVTKKKALEKLALVTNKIGYPDKWRDYSKVKIVRGDLAGNVERATQFNVAYHLNKIGKPVDRMEWGMTPPAVNAYYSPSDNNINFPAGILQPPFFDKSMDDAVNFGAIGAVIAHELTHGFDDQGRKFDGQGNLRDWWTAEDGRQFEQRANCIVNEYSGFVAVADVKLNGKLTLGENSADNGGVRLAYMALQKLMAGKTPQPIDGFTPDQRFFLGFAQIWCQNVTPESARLRAYTDVHSSGQWRVNGVVQNMPEFQKAFGCKTGQPMVSAEACRVW